MVSNGLSIFNSSFHDSLFSALARFAPLQWKKNSPTHKLTQRKAALKTLNAKSKTISQRVKKRTLRNISANIAALPVEAIPAIGTGVVIAITAMDLRDACADLKDMDELTSLFESQNDSSDTSKICGMSLNN